MGTPITERLGKTLAVIVLVPFIMLMLTILIVLMPLLPIIAFIFPETVKIKGK